MSGRPPHNRGGAFGGGGDRGAYDNNRQPYNNNRRPYDNNQRPYDNNRRPPNPHSGGGVGEITTGFGNTHISPREPPAGIYLENTPPEEPDASVTAKENELVEATRDREFETENGAAKYPGRRGYGTTGRPITLRTNYLRMATPYDPDQTANTQDRTIEVYTINIVPEPSKDKRRRLVAQILQDARFAHKHVATDYANAIVTTGNVDFGPSERWTDEIILAAQISDLDAQGNKVPHEAQPTGSSNPGAPIPTFVQQARDRNKFNFTVVYQDTLSLRHVMEELCSTSIRPGHAGRVDVFQWLNIIVHQVTQSDDTVAKVGQNKFYPFGSNPNKNPKELGGGLEAYKGFFSSVRPAVNRLLLNINITSGAFYKAINLSNLIDLVSKGEPGMPKMSPKEVDGFLKMLKIDVEYKPTDAFKKPFVKTKTVVQIAWTNDKQYGLVFGTVRQVMFDYVDSSQPNAQPRKISVYDYFKTVRNMPLRNPDGYVVNVGTATNKQWFPAEICTVVGGQPYQRLLSGSQPEKMIGFSAIRPNQNAALITGTPQQPGNGVRLFGLTNGANVSPQVTTLHQFGFSVRTTMITVPGRVLMSPRVTYGGNKSPNTNGGKWNLQNQTFAVPGRIGKWAILVINNPKTQSPPEDLFAFFESSLKNTGVILGPRQQTKHILVNLAQDRKVNEDKIKNSFAGAKNMGIQFLFIILAESDKWLYSRIKFYGDVAHGIHTVNAIGHKFMKPKGQDMYFANLALKFNIKGGGVCHKLLPGKPFDRDTMLMGIDVTHPSPGSVQGAPSIACVVASVDEHLFQWPGSVRTQAGKQEMVSGLEEMVVERLNSWQKRNNGRLPTKIILYRDGVSESQYESVLTQEVPPIEQAFAKKYGKSENWPKFAVVVVGKRHHTRFYPTQRQDGDNSFNPLPGTIVDRGISQRILGEFWLQAHQGLQGTAKPAHYVIIKDGIKLEMDEFQRFTHNLCYLFNRATKAVSICPPAYYADILCERGRCYLHSQMNETSYDGSAYNATSAAWTRNVHDNLRESTWYI